MQLPRVDIQGTSVRPVVPATLAIGHAHSATEAAMKYMSDPFPASRDQHAFQIASRTFFTVKTDGDGSRVVGHGLSLPRLRDYFARFWVASRNLGRKTKSRRVVSRSCLAEGKPPATAHKLLAAAAAAAAWQQQLSNNIELAAVTSPDGRWPWPQWFMPPLA